MEIIISIKDKLKEKNITQKNLAQLTGLREATISEILNNRRSTINRKHLGLITKALEVEDMNEIIKMRVTSKIKK